MAGDDTRPRFGKVKRTDGTVQAISFRPAEGDPMTFEAVDPITDEVVEIGEGDLLSVDVIGPGQSIIIARRGIDTTATTPAEWRRKKEATEMEDNMKDTPRHAKNPDPNGWWKALAGLAGLAAIIVLTIKGIAWAIS